jgi:hypothetical protein
VERVNLWQVLKKFSNDIDLNQEVRIQSFNRNVHNHMYDFVSHMHCTGTGAVLVLSKGGHANFFLFSKSQSANSLARSAITNMQISEVCQTENRISANL